MEEWKICFERYEISNLGNCRIKYLNGNYKKVKGSIINRGRDGYKYFQVKRGGKRVNKFFHYLVAEQFIGVRPDGLVIDHIDRNSLNNKVSNLRYITQEENMRNSCKYREDLPTDKNERRRILQRERLKRLGKTRNINSTKYNNLPYKKPTDRVECETCKKILSRKYLPTHNKQYH